MDQKLKNYSSGMQVRLAFSVAIKAQGDILVLDEVLAVGDEAFQRKCDTFFANIKKDPTKTVILVTHDMSAVKKYCNKAILIKDGNIIVSGDKDEVADKYSLENLQVEQSKPDNRKQNDKSEVMDKYPTGLNERVPLLRLMPVSKQVVTSDDNFVFDFEYEFNENVPFYAAFALSDIKRGGISYDSGSIRLNRTGHHTVRFSVPMKLFNSTDFKISASLREDDPENPYDTKMVAFTNEQNSCSFSVRNDYRQPSYALIAADKVDTKHQYVY